MFTSISRKNIPKEGMISVFVEFINNTNTGLHADLCNIDIMSSIAVLVIFVSITLFTFISLSNRRFV